MKNLQEVFKGITKDTEAKLATQGTMAEDLLALFKKEKNKKHYFTIANLLDRMHQDLMDATKKINQTVAQEFLASMYAFSEKLPKVSGNSENQDVQKILAQQKNILGTPNSNKEKLTKMLELQKELEKKISSKKNPLIEEALNTFKKTIKDLDTFAGVGNSFLKKKDLWLQTLKSKVQKTVETMYAENLEKDIKKAM